MVNWLNAKTQFKNILNRNSVEITWLQRVSSGSEAYDTGSASYGYGDPTVYYVTGSFKGLIAFVEAEEIVLDAGFYLEDYQKIYFNPDLGLAQWDQIILNDVNEKYLVTKINNYRAGPANVVACYAVVRRLVPSSKGVYE